MIVQTQSGCRTEYGLCGDENAWIRPKILSYLRKQVEDCILLATMQRTLVRTIQLAILCIVVVTATFLSHPTSLAFALAALGRGQCSARQAYRGVQAHARLNPQAAAIRGASRMLQGDAAGYHLWSTPQGRFWVPANSDLVLPILLAQQQADYYGRGQCVVRRGDIVLDCGAHVGVFTRRALDLGASLVVAIEPAPENLECLRRNFAQEVRQGRVIVYPRGVWDKEDILVLKTVKGNSAGDSFVLEWGRATGSRSP